jgi:regulator of protease activity HflC (stomatin/prohibitin superfamily)
MPVVARHPFLRHLRCDATEHVVQLRRGQVSRSGAGLAFWFRPLTTALSVVPVDDRELPLLFHARTADYQDVVVQAAVAFRFTDPAAAARRIDFSVDSSTGRWQADPLTQVAGLLTGLAQQHALQVVAALPLQQALAGGADGGVAQVRERVATGLAADERPASIGLEVVGVQVVALRPEPDVERALQTPARELVQQEADRATYERRAMAVERERAISENELTSKIALATQEQALVAQQGANARRRATEAAAAAAVENQSEADGTRLRAAAEADAIRLRGEAEGQAETARMAAYAQIDPGLLIALGLRELAGHLPPIGSLTLTPDVVQQALARFAGGGS